jgi:hypothetical protein
MLSFLHDTQHHATLRCTVLYCITTSLLILSLSNTLDSPSYTVSLLLSLPTSHLPLSLLSFLSLLSSPSLSPSSSSSSFFPISYPPSKPPSPSFPSSPSHPLLFLFHTLPTYFPISILPYLTLPPSPPSSFPLETRGSSPAAFYTEKFLNFPLCHGIASNGSIQSSTG